MNESQQYGLWYFSTVYHGALEKLTLKCVRKKGTMLSKLTFHILRNDYLNRLHSIVGLKHSFWSQNSQFSKLLFNIRFFKQNMAWSLIIWGIPSRIATSHSISHVEKLCLTAGLYKLWMRHRNDWEFVKIHVLSGKSLLISFRLDTNLLKVSTNLFK